MTQKRSYIDADGEVGELDAAFFREARPIHDFPEIVAALERAGVSVGRPPLPPERKKQRVTLHLDPDVLAALRKDGKGWQTRANAALRRALGL